MQDRSIINAMNGKLIVKLELNDEGYEVFEMHQVKRQGVGVKELVARGIVGMKQGGSWPILNPGHRKK